MSSEKHWPAEWDELRNNILKQPPCPQHREYPHVKTLTQLVINDIVDVSDAGITVRSHRTKHEDFIDERRFRTWWEFLVANGSASLDPGGPANPHPWRSRIVGAIMATCLPTRISVANSRTIELVRYPSG